MNPPVASKEPANVRTPVTTVTSEEPVVRHSSVIILCFVYNSPDVDVSFEAEDVTLFFLQLLDIPQVSLCGAVRLHDVKCLLRQWLTESTGATTKLFAQLS